MNLSVAPLLLEGCKTKILNPIVVSVSVDVIDLPVAWILPVVKGPGDSVGQPKAPVNFDLPMARGI